MGKGLKLIAWYKGIVGISAIALAMASLLYDPQSLNAHIFTIAKVHLQESPADFFLNIAVPYLPFINVSTLWIFFAATILFGIGNIAVAYEISRERNKPIVLAFWTLLLFLPIELLSLTKAFKVGKSLLFFANLFIVLYLFRYIKIKGISFMPHLHGRRKV